MYCTREVWEVETPTLCSVSSRPCVTSSRRRSHSASSTSTVCWIARMDSSARKPHLEVAYIRLMQEWERKDVGDAQLGAVVESDDGVCIAGVFVVIGAVDRAMFNAGQASSAIDEEILHQKLGTSFRLRCHAYRRYLIEDYPAAWMGWVGGFSELTTKKRKEREGEHERRKSMWSGGGGEVNFSNPDRMPAMPDWMADLASRADPDERMIRSSRAEPTEHAVMIAQRVWFLAMKKLGLRQQAVHAGDANLGCFFYMTGPTALPSPVAKRKTSEGHTSRVAVSELTPELTGLHLHGLNTSTLLSFTTQPHSVVDAFAAEWGIKTKSVELGSIKEVREFAAEAGKKGEWEDELVEGFVCGAREGEQRDGCTAEPKSTPRPPKRKPGPEPGLAVPAERAVGVLRGRVGGVLAEGGEEGRVEGRALRNAPPYPPSRAIWANSVMVALLSRSRLRARPSANPDPNPGLLCLRSVPWPSDMGERRDGCTAELKSTPRPPKRKPGPEPGLAVPAERAVAPLTRPASHPVRPARVRAATPVPSRIAAAWMGWVEAGADSGA
ncbi:hypothetical protein B0H14DRAFT_2604461 [Mycena olivaceomarginata]|nr:hypothetical protein B0H14DRAFT_2604461 [Mycena olivaceomarginata]